MSSIAEWNEQYADVNPFPEEKRGGFNWQMNIAYPCKVTKARVARSQRGDVQLELAIDVQSGEDEDAPTLGREKQWIDLPKQESDKGKARELVEKMTVRRFANLMRVYSAAMPGDYAPYKECKEQGQKRTYIGFDDKEMEGQDFHERKLETQARIVKTAEDLHAQEGQEVELLEGTLLYIEKAPNPKSDKYPYVNYYATRPRSTPVYKAEDTSTPF